MGKGWMECSNSLSSLIYYLHFYETFTKIHDTYKYLNNINKFRYSSNKNKKMTNFSLFITVSILKDSPIRLETRRAVHGKENGDQRMFLSWVCVP